MTEDTKTLTLTEFLLARIAEDEAEAGQVYMVWDFFSGDGESLKVKVLAECEAKRRIVELSEHYVAERRRLMGGWLSPDDESPTTVRALAAVYADHPDYDESWRP